MNLRIPGPTPCPDRVLQAMSRQMINHRGKEFSEIIQQVTLRLKQLFQTRGDVFVLTCSGTGGMEAAIVNTLSPGDKVLSVSNGAFGDRFATIAERFGANVTRLRFEWGKGNDPDAMKKALDAEPAIKAVLVTHNETSTGVTNDLKTIGGLVRSYDKLLLVDGISSVGCIELPVDAWGCDVVVTGSQKGFMVPPGLALVSVSERAWRAHASAKMPRFYWDFTKARDLLAKNQTPWTPAVSIFFAMSVSLEMMMHEGMDNIYLRHRRVAKRARDGVKRLGLSLFAEERFASDTITAIKSPEGVDAKRLLDILRDEHGTVLAGGQEKLQGKIFRIGHLGYVNDRDIDITLEAIRLALPKVGHDVLGRVG